MGLEAAETSLGAPGARSGFVALFTLTVFGFGAAMEDAAAL